MHKSFKSLAAVFLGCVLGFCSLQTNLHAASNTMTITEKSGLATTNYPVQFGRPFKQGEIANFPQVLLSGNPVATQADVKNRYADGSVKFAIINILIPQLNPNQLINVSFQNQATSNNAGFLNSAGMLATGYNFDARISISNSSTSANASARPMLTNGNFTYWLQGPVATSIILADHSAGRTYDIGLDAFRSLRPIFHATFYPTINKVRVRMIGENSNPSVAQNITYNLALFTGSSTPTQVYSKSNLIQAFGTRWAKEFWIGGAPSEIEINHNPAYLIETKFFPNYDLSKQIPTSVIDGEWSHWSGLPHDLFDPAGVTPYMSQTGGRDDIGLEPGWTVRWLFTQDNRARTMMLGNADVLGFFPVHFRENNPTKWFDKAHTVSGGGRVVSIIGRPTQFFGDGNGYLNHFANSADAFTIVNPISLNGFTPDNSHQPELPYAAYVITGDFWYLEEGWFDNSWAALCTSIGGVAWGRGPDGTMGYITDQVRGQAWRFRNLANFSFISPDGTPERDYFNHLIFDAISIWEGERNVRGTAFENSPEWTWGNTVSTSSVYGGRGLPPLHAWITGEAPRLASETTLNMTEVANAVAPWEHSKLTASLGRAQELGYPTGALKSWIAQFLISQATDAQFSPYYLGAYQTPNVSTRDTTHFYPTWSSVLIGYNPTYNAQATFQGGINDTTHGYPNILSVAASFITQEPGGSTLWQFLVNEGIIDNPLRNTNPKLAVLPRITSGGGTNPPLLTQVNPNRIQVAAGGHIVLSGSNFDSAFLGLDLNSTFFPRAQLALNFVSANQITWDIPANGLAVDVYSIDVVNSDHQHSNSLTFVVENPASHPAPSLTSITPNNFSNAASQVVQLAGANFDPLAVVKFNGTALASSLVAVQSATLINVNLPANYAANSYSVTVQNPDLQSSSSLLLTVTASGGGGGGGTGSGTLRLSGGNSTNQVRSSTDPEIINFRVDGSQVAGSQAYILGSLTQGSVTTLPDGSILAIQWDALTDYTFNQQAIVHMPAGSTALSIPTDVPPTMAYFVAIVQLNDGHFLQSNVLSVQLGATSQTNAPTSGGKEVTLAVDDTLSCQAGNAKSLDLSMLLATFGLPFWHFFARRRISAAAIR